MKCEAAHPRGKNEGTRRARKNPDEIWGAESAPFLGTPNLIFLDISKDLGTLPPHWESWGKQRFVKETKELLQGKDTVDNDERGPQV